MYQTQHSFHSSTNWSRCLVSTTRGGATFSNHAAPRRTEGRSTDTAPSTPVSRHGDCLGPHHPGEPRPCACEQTNIGNVGAIARFRGSAPEACLSIAIRPKVTAGRPITPLHL